VHFLRHPFPQVKDQPAMMRIIGLGSPNGDDSIGWRCLQSIEKELEELATQLDMVYCATPATRLIHLLQADVATILVDALLTDAEPARVYALDASELQQPDTLSSHQISVANILQLAAYLQRLPQQLHILGIAINPRRPLNQQQFQKIQQQLIQHISDLAETAGGT
jgi:hydrogenase maturation protease